MVTVENGVVVVDDSSDGSNVVTSLVLTDGEPAPQPRAKRAALRGTFRRRMIPLSRSDADDHSGALTLTAELVDVIRARLYAVSMGR